MGPPEGRRPPPQPAGIPPRRGGGRGRCGGSSRGTRAGRASRCRRVASVPRSPPDDRHRRALPSRTLRLVRRDRPRPGATGGALPHHHRPDPDTDARAGSRPTPGQPRRRRTTASSDRWCRATKLSAAVGVGSSLFDSRYGFASVKPAVLKPMVSFPDDNLDQSQCHGDVSLALYADRGRHRHSRTAGHHQVHTGGHAAPVAHRRLRQCPPAHRGATESPRLQRWHRQPQCPFRRRYERAWCGCGPGTRSRHGRLAVPTRSSGSSGCWPSSGTGCLSASRS